MARNSIAGAWIAHRLEMRISPAWRALPDNARRVLDRLEVEHLQHGGRENGRLRVTYDEFARCGIRRPSISLALRECVGLGFLEVTFQGGRAISDARFPSTYRLTYVHGRDDGVAKGTKYERDIAGPSGVKIEDVIDVVDPLIVEAGAEFLPSEHWGRFKNCLCGVSFKGRWATEEEARREAHWTANPTHAPWHAGRIQPDNYAYAKEQDALREHFEMEGLECWSGDSFAEYAVPERTWVVENWIPGENVTLFYGDGAMGKSTVALQLAIAAATGTKWLGKDVKRGPALFLSGEDDLDEMHRRVHAVIAGMRLDYAALTDLHFSDLSYDAMMMTPNEEIGPGLHPTEALRQVQTTIAYLKPCVVIVDPVADFFGGDENKKADVRAFVSMLRNLAKQMHTTFVVTAHPSQAGMASGTGTSGNVAWSNSVRSRIYMTRPVDAESKKAADPNLRLLEVMKSNYGPAGLKITARYDRGAYVLTDSPASKPSAELDADACALFMSLLAQLSREGRHVSHQPGTTWAPKVFGAHDGAKGIGKSAFARAMNTLFTQQRIKIETTGPASRRRSHIVETMPETTSNV